jgi:hypothetical protein
MATIEPYGREVIPRVRQLITAAPDDTQAESVSRVAVTA